MPETQKNPNMENLEKTAKRFGDVSEAVAGMSTGAIYHLLDECGRKDEDGSFIGLKENPDEKAVAEKLQGYMQEMFYTTIAGMSPEKFKRIKEEFFGEPGDVNGNPVGDLLGASNHLPGAVDFATLVQKLYREGVKGMAGAHEKIMGEFGGQTTSGVLANAIPRNQDQLNAMRGFIKEYNPNAPDNLAEIVDPKQLLGLYSQSAIGYMINQQSRN